MPSRSCAPHGCLQRSDSAGREDGYHDVQCSQIFNVVTKKKTSFQLFLKLVQEAFGQLVLNANKLIWLWMHERARRSCTFGSLRKTIKLSGEWFGTFFITTSLILPSFTFARSPKKCILLHIFHSISCFTMTSEIFILFESKQESEWLPVTIHLSDYWL